MGQAVAFRGKTPGDPTIQLSVAPTQTWVTTEINSCHVALHIDGVAQALDYMVDGIEVKYDEGCPFLTLDLGGYLSASINFKRNTKSGTCIISGDVNLENCQTAHNDIAGLFGTPNRNALDDWMKPDGSKVEIPHTNEKNMLKALNKPSF